MGTSLNKKYRNVFHIVWGIKNSKLSWRLMNLNAEMILNACPLSEIEEVSITQTIADIIKTDNLKCLAYNICRNHVHILLACNEKEISNIVRNMKSKSAKICNILMGRTIPKCVPNSDKETNSNIISSDSTGNFLEDSEYTQIKHGKTQFPLWAQKYHVHYIFDHEQFVNTIKYIENNRKKHELPDNSIELKSIIVGMICAFEE
jgi:REP element-mobilizing transposase RayT